MDSTAPTFETLFDLVQEAGAQEAGLRQAGIQEARIRHDGDRDRRVFEARRLAGRLVLDARAPAEGEALAERFVTFFSLMENAAERGEPAPRIARMRTETLDALNDLHAAAMGAPAAPAPASGEGRDATPPAEPAEDGAARRAPGSTLMKWSLSALAAATVAGIVASE